MSSLQLLSSPKHTHDSYSRPVSTSSHDQQFLDEKSDILSNDFLAMAEASTSLLNHLTNSGDASILNFSDNGELNEDSNFFKLQKNLAKCFNNNNTSNNNIDLSQENRAAYQLSQNIQKFQSLGQNIQSQQHVFSGRHAMWGYFDVSRQHTGYYYCKAEAECNSAYTWPPSTTVAGRHMRDRHPEVYVRIMEEEAVRKMTSDSQVSQQQRTAANVAFYNSRKRPASSNSNISQTISLNLSSLSNCSTHQNLLRNGTSNNKFLSLSDASATFDSRPVKSVKLEDIISCISTNHENSEASNLSILETVSKSKNFSPPLVNKRKSSAQLSFLNNVRSNLLKGFLCTKLNVYFCIKF